MGNPKETAIIVPGECPICGQAFRDSVVWCATCKTPHHKDCFSYAGHCAVYGCTGRSFQGFPEVKGADDHALLRTGEGEPVPQFFVADAPARFNYLKKGVTAVLWAFCFLTLPYWLIMWLAFLLGQVPVGKLTVFEILVLASPFLLALWFQLQKRIGNHHVLDRKERTIWFRSDLSGFCLRQKAITSFDDCQKLFLRCVHQGHSQDGEDVFCWDLHVGLSNGGTIPLSCEMHGSRKDPYTMPEPPLELRLAAEQASEILGLPLDVVRA
jgi:hypothetical protein